MASLAASFVATHAGDGRSSGPDGQNGPELIVSNGSVPEAQRERLCKRGNGRFHGCDVLNPFYQVLLMVDLQVGLTPLVKDWETTHYKNAIFAHAALGKLFDLPVIMTTSFQTGPNGPLPKEFLETYPAAPLIARPGQIDAWNNEVFRAAVKATNRSQMIITTDVCVAQLALSMRAEGYHVAVNAEASATFNKRVAKHAFSRMQAAGVQIMNMSSILTSALAIAHQAELFRDWRNLSPNASQVIAYLDRYLPEESWAVHAHAAAIDGGEIVGGENATVAIVPDSCEPVL